MRSSKEARKTLDPSVTALGALRPTGAAGRIYGPTGIEGGTQHQRHAAVEHIFRMAAATGMVGTHRDDDYAVLDGYDDNGDIVADYGIRSRRGFQFLYRKLQWRWNRTD